MPSEQPRTVVDAIVEHSRRSNRQRKHAADTALHQIETLLRNCDADPVTTLAKVHEISTAYFCKDFTP